MCENELTIQLEHLHTLSALVLANESEVSLGFQLVDVLWLHLVTVAVALPCDLLSTIQLTQLAALCVGLKNGCPQTETHSSSHVGLGDFWHEADDGVGSLLGQLCRVCVGQSTYVACPFDDRDLETKTYTKEGDILLTRPLDRSNHTLCSADTETSRNDHSLCRAHCTPSIMVTHWVLRLHLGFKVGRVDPVELELAATTHGRVLERLNDTHVRVLKGSVFADQNDLDRLVQALSAESHVAPACHEVLTRLLHLGGNGDGVKVEALLEEVDEALFLEQEGDVVGGRNVVDTKDLLLLDVAEVGDLFCRNGEELVLAATGEEIGDKSKTTQVSNTGLGRLGLLLAADDGDEGDVDEGKVLVADTELELAHCLDEWGGLDVTDCSAELELVGL